MLRVPRLLHHACTFRPCYWRLSSTPHVSSGFACAPVRWLLKISFSASNWPYQERTSSQAYNGCHPYRAGLAWALVRLAAGLSGRAARDLYPMASTRISPVLEMEIEPGSTPIPPELQALIRQMAQENPTWGQERIANELLLKLGLRVSPRTVRKYMPKYLDLVRSTRAVSALGDVCP